MPYITLERRAALLECLGEESSDEFMKANTAGELNYLFTILARDYIQTHGLSYQTINDIVGALEGAKLEFVRRVVNPYEDERIKSNGDVYGGE